MIAVIVKGRKIKKSTHNPQFISNPNKIQESLANANVKRATAVHV